MTESNDGGPAFPRPYSEQGDEIAHWEHHAYSGMSLRDWFAGQALPACISTHPGGLGEITDAANDAYNYADAMLKARYK